ncbi:sugar ABC transporter ATP-binding protein [Paenibacillus sp. GCM10023248]|uniref:sugar ABC transporter ATP-binding protein n=1 Tax=Bacillales TaxID=1385 RepID=UPI00237985B9|nr:MULTISPECIES: sugar ABC transporter ATP-binding protein [Bacillales]MDD9268937.1 sugar ABC transporter ATP-binding protein [Paenibacillus sp. MAHUQ-63]MDR6881984.1 ribose transport system ATP-binding protein [Bacillus sp. 3255]
MTHPLVQMEGIYKGFPGVQALSDCQFELAPGEVHALVGENGAGKSTLMKILTGIYQKDAGRLLLKGREVHIPHTKAAQSLGVSIIHQELNLIPDLTIAQNMFIGREPRRKVRMLLDEKKMNADTVELLEQLNLDLDPRMKISELSVAKQQMIEIAKALSFKSDVLIMDEPTAALTDAEIGELFRMIARLRSSGVGIVYISHRMEELRVISDRITVMRDGRYIATVKTKDTSMDSVISMMVGRELQVEKRKPEKPGQAKTVLEVRGLSRAKAFEGIQFTVRAGEIVGVAGLMGAGRTEVARAIFGADRLDAGEIYVNGQQVRIRGTHDAVKHGIGYLSEDRKRYGLLVDMDVGANMALPSLTKLMRFGWMREGEIEQVSASYVEALKIKTPGIRQKAKFLSGGNQQKIVIGKWLYRDCQLLIFDEPTRGIDVGAKAEIYALLEQLAQQGKAILMISSELPEILRLSHRVLVMCEGRITGELIGEQATQENIMRLATSRN